LGLSPFRKCSYRAHNQKASGRENHWPKGVALFGSKSKTKM
jgi:hypothetical protein